MELTNLLKTNFFKTVPEVLGVEWRNLANPPQWLLEVWGVGTESKAGIKINEDNALQSAAVFSCVRVLAESVASLPLLTYRRLPQGGKERVSNHNLFGLLHDLPNPLITSFEFRETLMGHVTLWGNAYAEIERDNGERIKGLWPLLPNKMSVEANKTKLRYFYTLPDGRTVEIPARNVFHIKGLSKNGYVGQSVISFAREAIGLSVAAEEFGSRFFSNNARPGGYYQHPGRLSPQARENLKKDREQAHKGLTQAHRIGILEEGMVFKEVGIPPEDAQFLETRKFQVNEIARMYRVPPHMIGDLEKATFSNIEHQSIDFVVHTLRPWLVRWEQAISRDLFEPEERSRFFAEFLVDGLLRGDIESRAKAYQTFWQMGALNQDEIREMENKNPIANGLGQLYYVPLNFAPIGERIEPDNVEIPPVDPSQENSRSRIKENGYDHTDDPASQHTN